MGLNEKFFKTSAVDDTPNFAPILYTGNWNGSNTNTIEVGFRPDWIWIKRIDGADSHHLYDSVRGMGKALYSNTTDPENASNHLNTTSTGFTLVTDNVNQNNNLFIAWCWKGGGSSVQNNDGSIQGANCLVSANVAAGFSIIKWRGNATNGATIGHGLNSAPELIIHKGLTNPTSWIIGIGGISGFSASDYLQFSSAAKSNSSTFFQGYGSNTFTVGVSSANEMNKNSSNYYIGYAFHSVSGVQKVGKYTGNGNNAGTIVDTGFTPRFLMIKSSSTNDNGGGAWIMYDNARSTSNPRSKRLFANFTAGEQDNVNYNLDFLTGSTKGFQPLNGASGGWGYNTLNVEYVYLAIA